MFSHSSDCLFITGNLILNNTVSVAWSGPYQAFKASLTTDLRRSQPGLKNESQEEEESHVHHFLTASQLRERGN